MAEVERKFSLDEQETTFTIEGTDRSTVHCYTNDPVYQRKLERVGIRPKQTEPDGGKFYTFPVNQLRLHKPPRKLTKAEKEAAAERFQRLREEAAE